MMHRREYVNAAAVGVGGNSYELHRQYYGQYVTPAVKALVLRVIGRSVLEETPDRRHFNTIGLHRWDPLVRILPYEVVLKLRENGDYLTLVGGVCILKEAARQLWEEWDDEGAPRAG
jgi:hypothetical protein